MIVLALKEHCNEEARQLQRITEIKKKVICALFSLLSEAVS